MKGIISLFLFFFGISEVKEHNLFTITDRQVLDNMNISPTKHSGTHVQGSLERQDGTIGRVYKNFQ